MSDLRAKLNAAKGLPQTNGHEPSIEKRIETFTGSPEELSRMVFGNEMISGGGKERIYDPNEEMKRLKQGIPPDLVKNSKLASTIKESIMQNPLIVPSADPKMDAFVQRLGKAAGVDKVTKIINQLDEVDNNIAQEKAKLNEVISGSTNIDYELIKTIVEEAVRKVSKELNESKTISNGNGEPSVKIMKMGESFMFLDSDDNVYECKMIYKGKNKRAKR